VRYWRARADLHLVCCRKLPERMGSGCRPPRAAFSGAVPDDIGVCAVPDTSIEDHGQHYAEYTGRTRNSFDGNGCSII
ncbi:unnamed protein product, partial [Symbiodinium necroappetens]